MERKFQLCVIPNFRVANYPRGSSNYVSYTNCTSLLTAKFTLRLFDALPYIFRTSRIKRVIKPPTHELFSFNRTNLYAFYALRFTL